MISIIGAGPAGSYLASLLAEKDEVTLFEEHDKIGEPVQCAGITTQALTDVVHVNKEFILNTVSNARIFAPNNEHLDIKLTRPNIILDRAGFDRHLAERAQDKGAKLLLGYRYKGCSRHGKELELHFENGKNIKTNALVGADGPFSKVAKTTGLWHGRRFAIGVQTTIRTEVDTDTVDFYTSHEWFGWVVPVSSKIARVGIATYSKPREHFKGFMKRTGFDKCKIEGYQSGMIPVFNPKIDTQDRNVYLLGDAATQVKATTFGGIVQGLMAAEELNKAIRKDVSYERRWRKRIGRDLRIGLLIRKKLDRFSDHHYNHLISMLRQSKAKEILESHDRDFPLKLLVRMLIRNPKLLRFAFI
ncbi:NAD(P)/FAD-dependent oxidoreductase [Candidatus Woesearchaeota archaeon]|nr:NAD(P)/FAD-dependent oxidoreductase [Candidatus Woesearchaeota archaeon]